MLNKVFQTEPLPNEISAVLVTRGDKPSIFIAAGSQIRGFTVKGKEFFKLDTSHSEVIRNVFVAGIDLWSTGLHTLNCYTSSGGKIVDKYYYMSDETIATMDVATINGVNLPILACGDQIRVIGSDGKVLYTAQMESQITCFSLQKEPTQRGGFVLVYGLRNGCIGAVELSGDEAVVLWECEWMMERSPISYLVADTLLHQNIALARDSGEIEIHRYSE